ncbi:OmpH family outer membrane protein [Sphingomonas sp. LB-2]|uniref:OmpH family outer membrane protein n=1 Tax=Sphingomonas caeni TaxID=2984949 RepID=UPI00222E272D|nr:OmpH family outer membrane protein [Sphingomonas caeni]MCW3849135.1 OmpH family outer membrane protein [Sphingomonas caeni]
MKTFKYLLLAAIAAPAAMVAVAPAAHAQVNGIATADPVSAMYMTKAWQTADQQIRTTFAAQYQQLEAKAAERQKLLAQLDKNGDKQVDDAELAGNPAVKGQVDKIDADMNQLSLPILLAKGFAIDRILERYEEAQRNVVNAKKIGVILAPNSFLYYPDAADVTGAITAELDKLVPTVSIQPVPNRRPSEQAMAVLEQFLRIDAARAAQAARQPAAPAAGGARPAGQPAAPAAGGTRPATTPATRPTTPPPGR